tara:strand:+ start:323 stop:529 length:207 start_codon:yes stop_codon:yes gene_type:complete
VVVESLVWQEMMEVAEGAVDFGAAEQGERATTLTATMAEQATPQPIMELAVAVVVAQLALAGPGILTR